MRWKKNTLPEHESLFALMEKRPPVKPLPRARGSRTSALASIRAEPKADSHSGLALALYRSRKAIGLADFEAIEALRPRWPTVDNGFRSRRQDLAERGLIVLAPSIRISPSGSECDVWIAKEYLENVDGHNRSVEPLGHTAR